ncbi:TlpA family protein disulfide reductase [Shewanella canadensis]|uniref:TlpA family protein disulfide reductase n=1 Tax=Shewanella canadensis TaxID=271096 RepID=A0A3S0IRM1_9GAMM|nr:TlpA disulfide reductase family protein [Shewanella canadensis]RTR40405.1 TlpA family protein disulfide reductase [Shewanella canadensis]
MNKTLILTCLLAFSSVFIPADAKSNKVYNTGEAINKPMIMSRFIEMQSAREVPDVTFTDTEGGEINLKQYKGKLVMVNLWATWCAPCIKEIPQMENIRQTNIDKDLVVLPISIDEESEKVKPFLARHGLAHYKTWLDPNKDIDQVMPADVVPATYVFDGSGNLIGFLRGYLDWGDEEVQPYLEKLIAKYAKR